MQLADNGHKCPISRRQLTQFSASCCFEFLMRIFIRRRDTNGLTVPSHPNEGTPHGQVSAGRSIWHPLALKRLALHHCRSTGTDPRYRIAKSGEWAWQSILHPEVPSWKAQGGLTSQFLALRNRLLAQVIGKGDVLRGSQ